MSDPKPPADPKYPVAPPVDERANQAFLDTIFDTDGKPDSEAVSIVETEGMDDEDDPDA